MPADLDTTCLKHVIPRTGLAFVWTYTAPRGKMEKTHLHSAGFPLIGGQPAPPPNLKPRTTASWGRGSLRFEVTEVQFHREQQCQPVVVVRALVPTWFFIPVPRSTSRASLQMVFGNQETRQRGHRVKLLSGCSSSWGSRYRKPATASASEDIVPPGHLTASCRAFRA